MNYRHLGPTALLVLLVLGAAAPASAGLSGASVSGDTFTATLDLGGAVGGTLTVSFESSKKLTTSSLGASADLLGATELAGIQARLPDPSISVPSAYPVLITLEPPAGEGLSFRGPATIELYTHTLSYLVGSKLRLFAAPLGGSFHDITESIAGGSYRVRGSKGEFSEFLIVTDLRSIDAVITDKLARLESLLAIHQSEIQAMTHATLVDLFDDVEAGYLAGDLTMAIADLDQLAATVIANSGSKIPDEWRAARDKENVAGKLRAAAATLRFSLAVKAGS